MYEAVTWDFSKILCEKYGDESNYVANSCSIHAHMCDALIVIGRWDHDRALIRWIETEQSSMMNLMKWKRYEALLLGVLARTIFIHSGFVNIC